MPFASYNVGILHATDLMESKSQNECADIIDLIIPICETEEDPINNENDATNQWPELQINEHPKGNIVANTTK